MVSISAPDHYPGNHGVCHFVVPHKDVREFNGYRAKQRDFEEII